MPTYTSFTCSGREALFLFQLMNIPEAEVLLAHLNDTALQGEQAERTYEKIKNDLIKDGVIESENNEIIIHPQVNQLLQSCKLSSAVIKLHLHTTNAEQSDPSMTYGFISGTNIVEWVWRPARDQVTLTTFESLQDLYHIMGNRIELPDSAEESLDTSIQKDTLQKLLTLKQLGMERITFALRQDQHVHSNAIQELAQAFANIQKHGQFEVSTRGMQDSPQMICFIGSSTGNWLFIENKENKQRETFTAFKITEEELIQSLFLLTTRTLSILPVV
ncbi:hypothetical protein [Paenibacillus xylanilyticus]|uniref:Uncharacterized protein n=1 Tax=Paenibacillus xylanilyticus TaxID=248903 RepID=A0A7Y6BV25_9BACL|nr:hypothetical protein [Paenibacillus xylanilyticus]NUU75437.1 hypothetical protein [Paenibacillus xylanilyticus]